MISLIKRSYTMGRDLNAVTSWKNRILISVFSHVHPDQLLKLNHKKNRNHFWTSQPCSKNLEKPAAYQDNIFRQHSKWRLFKTVGNTMLSCYSSSILQVFPTLPRYKQRTNIKPYELYSQSQQLVMLLKNKTISLLRLISKVGYTLVFQHIHIKQYTLYSKT